MSDAKWSVDEIKRAMQDFSNNFISLDCINSKSCDIAIDCMCECIMQNDNVRNKGTWLSKYDDKYGFHYVCSEYGTISGVKLKFCFDCGADMRGDKNG